MELAWWRALLWVVQLEVLLHGSVVHNALDRSCCSVLWSVQAQDSFLLLMQFGSLLLLGKAAGLLLL
jgi:hypothetical protein